MAAPPEGTAREAPRRGLLRHPRHHQAAGRRRAGCWGDDAAWLSLLQVWGVGTRSRRFSFLVFLFLWVARHMTLSDLLSLCFGPSRWDGGCCAGGAAPGLLRQGSSIEGHVWESYQDTRRKLIVRQLL